MKRRINKEHSELAETLISAWKVMRLAPNCKLKSKLENRINKELRFAGYSPIEILMILGYDGIPYNYTLKNRRGIHV